ASSRGESRCSSLPFSLVLVLPLVAGGVAVASFSAMNHLQGPLGAAGYFGPKGLLCQAGHSLISPGAQPTLNESSECAPSPETAFPICPGGPIGWVDGAAAVCRGNFAPECRVGSNSGCLANSGCCRRA